MTVKIGCKDSHKSFWDIWDAGHHALNENEGRVWKHPEGEKIGDLLSDWTVCPIGNASCQNAAYLELYATNPDKGGKAVKVMLCPLGVEGDGEKCPLNK